jgi:UDP-N-acetylmuramoylalanine--D-glutamate ligase
VRYIDDSKATNPHATLAALDGLDSVILIAGGRNKGLDFQPLRGRAQHLKLVVGIGEAAQDVVTTFEGAVPTRIAASMHEAVVIASQAARSGDTVLLSPACASFDWYGSYSERGDDFAREVHAVTGATR